MEKERPPKLLISGGEYDRFYEKRPASTTISS
jgi:hypothetical protein